MDRDIEYAIKGNDVDAVIIDTGVSVLHPEFIASNGDYRVRDVILDGPMKVDPAAFSGYTQAAVVDSVNIGTRAWEARARAWWGSTANRSAAFQSLGTIAITSAYTRVHAHGKTGTNAITNNHGTCCASQIGGKHHGFAFECNIWNIRISLTGAGGFLSSSVALNACKIWHQAKKIAFSIANSPLVKTAVAGEDANWGRVIMAIGKSEENINQNKIKVSFGNNIVCEDGSMSKKINITKPKVAILSGTEDPIESMPSSMDAKTIMERAIKDHIDAFVHGPLAFDNAVSPEAAKIKKIHNEVAGKADILLVPNLETGNSLSKIMVYFMGACAAGFIVGGKVPVVVTSRADNTASRVYIKNTGSSSTDYFTLTIASGNSVIGRLYGGDFAWFPYEGEEDIDISSTGTNMELEFMVLNEG